MPPNILLLVGEDTGRHHGCYGNPLARTPNIDALAASGVRFTNACSTAPVCAPSRSTLVTGQYAFSIGSHHMRSTLLDPPRLFTQELRDQGYFVNWTNKTDFNFEPPPAFADDCSDWVEDLAAGRLADRPWLLYWNFEVTHESTMWPESWQKRVQPQLEPALRTDPDAVEVPPYLPDTPEVRANIARYHDSLAIQDRQVGRVLEALEQSGLADNTIVLYLSDHGRGLPREKRWCYEAGIHLPLIVRWPGVLHPGTTDDQLVSWVDFAPTLLRIAGIDPPADLPGRCFLGPQADPEPRTACFAGRDRMDEAYDRVRALRTQNHLYIRNFFPDIPYAQRNHYMEKMQTMQVLREADASGQLNPAQAAWMAETKPREELFDTTADPHCIHNLAGDPGSQTLLRSLRAELDTFLDSAGDLGQLPEQTLIDRGLVQNRLPEYRERVEPLPERYRKGPTPGPVEMPNPSSSPSSSSS